MNKLTIILIVVLSVILYCTSVFAVTVVVEQDNVASYENVKKKSKSKDSTIRLISWSGDKLLTTHGTFLITDMKVDNLTGLTKEKIGVQNNLPSVNLVKKDGQVVKIIIFTQK